MLLLFACVAVFLAGRLTGKGPDKSRGPGRKVPDFRLTEPRQGKSLALSHYKDKKAVVVVFLGTECPVNNLYLAVLADLHKAYAGKGVQFLGVYSNDHESAAEIAEHARKNELPFPVLKDSGNKVADAFGAKRTPEAFVLDGARKIVYDGRIDDQFGVSYRRPGKPVRRDLAEALVEVLAGKPVSIAETRVEGCLINRVKKAASSGRVTYAKDVARILQSNCQECHRPGQVGPMSLLTYKSAVAWAGPIREALTEERMPPWYADPKHGKWRNDRRLSKEDKATLLAWLDAGTPKGDDRDLPPKRDFPDGWVIGTPDVIIKMPKPFPVPAETPKDGVPYQYFSVDPGFKEDRWVESAEARPGSPEVVHHIIVFIAPKDGKLNMEGQGNLLTGEAPGDMPTILEPGQGRLIPAGSKLVFQMHYTPNGKAQTDQSSVGLIFCKKKPRHRVFTIPVANMWFEQRWFTIPAGADNFKIESNFRVPMDAHIIDFMPHMHLRGKDFLYEAIYPDGTRKTLLSVPKYYFGWQSMYRCAEPVALPRGTRLHCVAHYDNSAKNLNNPDPSRPIAWGDQTWEEMMIGWVSIYFDHDKP
jgi:peroxiredoxin